METTRPQVPQAVQFDKPAVNSRLVETVEGATIAIHDLGGDGPALLLAHATGFHGLVFKPLAAALSASFHCIAFDERAHGASSRPTTGSFAWTGFAEDVLAVVDAMGLKAAWGFGHSAGGAALLLAEERRPGTFNGLFCYEPVVFAMPSQLPPEGMPNNPLTKHALRRQEVFDSRDAALLNFSGKAPLSSMSPAALRAYVDHGFADLPNGRVRLQCRREDEAEIYAQGFAHDTYAHLHEITCPVTLCYGERTNSIGAPLIEKIAEQVAEVRIVRMPSLGHLGPLEDPAACAVEIVDAFDFQVKQGSDGPT
ncbi:MAG: alpha/beta fold hydrolase [Acidimicrobiales bacterium]